ncbi:hypothetical protein [Paenibacillus melissococcoides]|uniref:hypothetical protein n=1 Tax=Paenibacillus melissococcoides TaxID=2912268 RepID=UPI0038B2EC58
MRIHIFVEKESIYNHLKKKIGNYEVSPFTNEERTIQQSIAVFQADAAIVELGLPFREEILHILNNFEIPVINFEDDFNEVIRAIKELDPDQPEEEEKDEITIIEEVIGKEKMGIYERVKSLWAKTRQENANKAERKAAEEQERLEAERKAAEEQERLEAERKAAEEQERLEAERKAAEEQERLEAERKAAEEQERLEAERKAAEEQERLEAERKAAEEQERLEAERKAAEEQERLEAERKAAEEQERLEAERKAAEEQERLEAERKAAEEQEAWNQFLEASHQEVEQKLTEKDVHNASEEATVSNVSFSSNRHLGSVTIAIGGYGRRTGASHTSIQLATYIKKKKEKVACVEMRSEHSSYKYFITEGTPNQHGGYQLDGITYYPNFQAERLHEVYAGGYSFVILDFGSIVEADRPTDGERLAEYFKADMSIISTFASIWDKGNLVYLMIVLKRMGWKKAASILVQTSCNDSFNGVMNMLDNRERKKGGLQFYRNPLSSDPFKLEEETIQVFDDLLSVYFFNKEEKSSMFSIPFLSRKR